MGFGGWRLDTVGANVRFTVCQLDPAFDQGV